MIEVYTSANCPYCVRAKMLLEKRGFAFTEYRIDQDSMKRDEMLSRAEGRRSVPQIFINGKPIGGSDDLHELDRQGKLVTMINEEQ